VSSVPLQLSVPYGNQHPRLPLLYGNQYPAAPVLPFPNSPASQPTAWALLSQEQGSIWAHVPYGNGSHSRTSYPQLRFQEGSRYFKSSSCIRWNPGPQLGIQYITTRLYLHPKSQPPRSLEKWETLSSKRLNCQLGLDPCSHSQTHHPVAELFPDTDRTTIFFPRALRQGLLLQHF
jgi:hypothetical protein